MHSITAASPPRIFPVVLGLIALPLVLGGAQLVFLGGSFYYLLAGLVLAASAIKLWQGNPFGTKIYAGLMVATVAWALMESGTNLWALAPRVLPFSAIGIWFLTPWLRRSLYKGNPPPLFSTNLSKTIPAAFVLLTIGVLISGMGYDVNPLSERSGINTVNTRTDWPSYGNTPGGSRYSPIDQINTENVADLEIAWTYRTEQGGAFKATPLQIGELLYVCTGGNVVIALDAESGELRWQFDPLLSPDHLASARYFTTGCRGVSYYAAPPEYSGECQQRILTATADARLIAIDAISGARCMQFGELGEVSLTQNMGNDPLIFNFQTSPPGIVRGNAVVGGWVLDNRSVGEPSGVVRAFDVITGEFAWAWDMGRPGIHTEPLRGEVYTRGTPNVWSLFSVDEDLGLIYAPTGNETPDYFAGQRMESSEQYASSIVAINGETGSVRWSFQTTHHDIWDYDVPSQPVLIDLPSATGEKLPAVLVPTKRAEVFVLNRITGEPIFDIPELPVPQDGGVPEDFVAATQPFTVDMPNFRPDLSEERMWGITPLDQMWCRIEFRKMRYEGHFTVPGADTILQFPGNAGGHNWGSVSVDQVNNIMIVNPLVMSNQLTLIPRDELPEGVQGSQQGTPYAHTTVRFISPLEVPCHEPPYGILAAVDLETKQLLWERPIGTAKNTGPFGIATRLPMTVGTPQTGGTVTTAGGLIFMAGTFDNTVRALDINDGSELWRRPLPFAAQATPMSYQSPQGKQTLVVTVPVFNRTGAVGPSTLPADEEDPLGGYIFAYRLPD
ncbi:MAG: membrane-bound PQQ-dependent dehydrogenase, glucose/quinate/shikimate family [Gammaproteobacteria bacterium]|jgi:quinate dehydrogenase (quinone)|nr:membrane-bound PQQ-dependent dehydrogenase, glucose/quinate/shikimate family [Gammaproteobacteria bacterium]MDP6096128.1 membrane-bound PQQ-dependent dehydrogenase, glucose/quinate/shikimate family [Gammaproteobacteria bacterium]MDP7456301.1 membrane-bound PQQ-dependent dehydrogenase, glucose/quinate/shikimate family [Gammaproteobacteria bacterium]|tara:strand:+ start:322 stop:2673 length:2352 start_codon:yes stop_codon:yes gene_type:complete